MCQATVWWTKNKLKQHRLPRRDVARSLNWTKIGLKLLPDHQTVQHRGSLNWTKIGLKRDPTRPAMGDVGTFELD